jgi:hypothetical protein
MDLKLPFIIKFKLAKITGYQKVAVFFLTNASWD